MESLTLYELNSLVRRTLDLTMCDEYWIRTEISSVSERGHCYLEFVQKDKYSDNIVAKARAQAWSNKWIGIRNRFESVTGQRLQSGMQVLVLARVTFHELYGYSLNITDIDPTYTLGDMARKRMEIMRQLHEEGVDGMNKELVLPRLLQRIAIISSPSAAGYGDFCNQLENNRSGLVFYKELFPAIMQGEGTERSIISALNAIAEMVDEWDVVVIIRGGGATSDLSGFDTLELAENVAQFPLPVITGIGHERDDTVLDMVAHTRVKTPTAAAEFLIHHQEAELHAVEELASELERSVGNILLREEHAIKLLTGKLPSLFSALKSREEARMERALNSIQSGIVQCTERQKMILESRQQQLHNATSNLITAQKHSLEKMEIILESASPQRILNMGFSITRLNGKAVSSVATLEKDDVLETTFAEGKIISIVQEKTT